MDALKKKMLAMKLEKENADEKSIQLQEKLKQKDEEKIKQEDDLNDLLKELQIKQQECDKVQLALSEVNTKCEETEKRATDAEAEVAALSRRMVLLQADIEQTENRFVEASEKLEVASKLAVVNEKERKEYEVKSTIEDEKLNHLEQQVKEAKYIAEDADRKYEEAARKLAISVVDLERTETRLEACELKTAELEEELTIMGKNMKSLEISEQEAMSREESYEDTIRDITERLKSSEQRAAEAERQVAKLESEVDRLEDDLLSEMEKYKGLSGELDFAFAELTNC